MSNTLIPTFHGDFQAREINIKKTFWGLEVKLTPSFPPHPPTDLDYEEFFF